MKDIIMKVELEQRDHQLDDLLRIFNKTFLQLFSITHLRKNSNRDKIKPQVIQRNIFTYVPIIWLGVKL